MQNRDLTIRAKDSDKININSDSFSGLIGSKDSSVDSLALSRESNLSALLPPSIPDILQQSITEDAA